MFLLFVSSPRMQRYFMPQSTIYFDQRFSPTLLVESPKSSNAAEVNYNGCPIEDSDALGPKE